MPAKIKDLAGQRFGRLTAEYPCGHTKQGSIIWRCKCDCGNETAVVGVLLTRGATTSCGCYAREVSSKVHTQHGLSNTKLYRIWAGMKSRCRDKTGNHFKTYAARGIAVCDEWENNFSDFYIWALANGYQDGLTIDRIDNGRGYSPANCRWVTEKAQHGNTRNNVMVSYRGENVKLIALSEITGIGLETLRDRIVRRGWDVERAVSQPVKIWQGRT